MSSDSDITDLLINWGEGDNSVLENLIPLVEKELRRLAHHYMNNERAGHLLQTTALVNEAYLRLINQRRVRWQNRAHFYGIAAQIMRRILLNYARDRRRKKRGGEQAIQVSLSDVCVMSSEKSSELIALDEALEKLAVIDERKSRVVELRFFGGLNAEESAEVLGVSAVTINRDWKMAKAWLSREMTHGCY